MELIKSSKVSVNNENAICDFLIKAKNLKSIIMPLTEICNFKCSYCYGSFYKNQDPKFCKYEKLELAFKNIQYNKVDMTVSLLGGEPTLHPKFLDILYLLNIFNNIKYISLVTNGSADLMLYKKMLDLNEKTFIKISYHPFNPLGMNYYLNLFNELDRDKFYIVYMLDNEVSLDDHLKNLEKFKGFNLEIMPLFHTIYNIEFEKILYDYYKRINYYILIDNKKITYYDIVKNDGNMFKNMYCKSLNNDFVLDNNMILSKACNMNFRCNALNFLETKKFFINSKKLQKCNLDECVCYVYQEKWI